MGESKRHYTPTGVALEDGLQLYHAYVRIDPADLEYIRLQAEHYRRSYAQVLGEYLSYAVRATIREASSPQELLDRMEQARRSQKAKPVRPQRRGRRVPQEG